jgi:hypothetical protein
MKNNQVKGLADGTRADLMPLNTVPLTTSDLYSDGTVRPAVPAGGSHSAVRVRISAGPFRGELKVSSSGSEGAPVSTATAILMLVVASALAASVVCVASWLAGGAIGLTACGILVAILSVGMYITFRRSIPRARRR